MAPYCTFTAIAKDWYSFRYNDHPSKNWGQRRYCNYPKRAIIDMHYLASKETSLCKLFWSHMFSFFVLLPINLVLLSIGIPVAIIVAPVVGAIFAVYKGLIITSRGVDYLAGKLAKFVMWITKRTIFQPLKERRDRALEKERREAERVRNRILIELKKNAPPPIYLVPIEQKPIPSSRSKDIQRALIDHAHYIIRINGIGDFLSRKKTFNNFRDDYRSKNPQNADWDTIGYQNVLLPLAKVLDAYIPENSRQALRWIFNMRYSEDKILWKEHFSLVQKFIEKHDLIDTYESFYIMQERKHSKRIQRAEKRENKRKSRRARRQAIWDGFSGMWNRRMCPTIKFVNDKRKDCEA